MLTQIAHARTHEMNSTRSLSPSLPLSHSLSHTHTHTHTVLDGNWLKVRHGAVHSVAMRMCVSAAGLWYGHG